MAFQKQNSAGFLANHMARLFAAALHRRIQPLGLAPAQFMVLLELWEEDGLTQRDLVERLNVEQATMANTLARMERDGLIRREPSKTDRRARLIRLTERARAVRDAATTAASEVNAEALGDLDAEEKAAFLDMMHRVVARLSRG